MAEDVFNPDYWAKRLATAVIRDQIHHAVYEVNMEEWAGVRYQHKRVLARYVGEKDSVLDVGCGWGRLLTMMPPAWTGPYLGVDLSPDFVKLATAANPDRQFVCCDVRHLPPVAPWKYDWAVFVSVREMVLKNVGAGSWQQILSAVGRHAAKALILEYDPNGEGEVIECGA